MIENSSGEVDVNSLEFFDLTLTLSNLTREVNCCHKNQRKEKVQCGSGTAVLISVLPEGQHFVHLASAQAILQTVNRALIFWSVQMRPQIQLLIWDSVSEKVLIATFKDTHSAAIIQCALRGTNAKFANFWKFWGPQCRDIATQAHQAALEMLAEVRVIFNNHNHRHKHQIWWRPLFFLGVDSSWGAWDSWGTCSRLCGGGVRGIGCTTR